MNVTTFIVYFASLVAIHFIATATTSATTDDDGTVHDRTVFNQWSQFQRQHDKHYADPTEARIRLKIFADNLLYIDEHNRAYDRGDTTFRMGVNEMSDQLTHEVNAARHCAITANDSSDVGDTLYVPPSGFRAPDYINWADRGAVTPVGNQGSYCLSCWAFGSAGALEGQRFIKFGRLVKLSKQNLVDCASYYGCNAPFYVSKAFDYVMSHGIDTEANYPYRGVTGRCHNKRPESGTKCSGYKLVTQSECSFLE